MHVDSLVIQAYCSQRSIACEALSWSGKSRPFMPAEVLLPCLPKRSNRRYPEPDKSSPHLYTPVLEGPNCTPTYACLFQVCSLRCYSQYSVRILNLSPCCMLRPFHTLAGWWLLKHNKCYWMSAIDRNATEIQTGYLRNVSTCYQDTLKHEAGQCCCTNMRHKRSQSIRWGDAIRAHVHWRHPTLCFQTFVISVRLSNR